MGAKVYRLKSGETTHVDSEIRHKLHNLSDEQRELVPRLSTP